MLSNTKGFNTSFEPCTSDILALNFCITKEIWFNEPSKFLFKGKVSASTQSISDNSLSILDRGIEFRGQDT